ncbi:MAG: MerR family transcriptional regulator [Actinobacteria bacterium]|nr:MerR family transcriptional regulator [Actinomycetota bacterium]
MGDDTRFSLGELARAAGMTTRNVRAYQTRGLIPPPLRVGRRSEYTTHHLERLRAIHRARAQGATLTLISDCLSRGDTIDLTRLPSESAHEWLPGPRVPADLTDAAGGRSPVPQQHRGADLSPLLDRARVADDPAVLAVVEDLLSAGVVARHGRRIVAGPGLVAAVTALHRRGLPVGLCLTVALRAAEGAADLAGRLGTEVTSGAPEVVDHVADLASGVLRGVLYGTLAERAAATG